MGDGWVAESALMVTPATMTRDIGNNGKYLAAFGTGASDRGQVYHLSHPRGTC